MGTEFSNIQKTSQHSQSSCDNALVEWKSIEMMEDFLNGSFETQRTIHLPTDVLVDENGIPKHLKQVFIA